MHDHESIDEALLAELGRHLDPGEIVELAACVARHLGFGRITRVFRLDHDTCALHPDDVR